jgi:hypothetical protein
MTVTKRAKDNGVDTIPPQLAAALQEMDTNSEPLDHLPGDSGTFVPKFAADNDVEDHDDLTDYRVEILGRAAHIVSADRNITYGPPEDSFDRIAALWNAYLGTDTLMATDVAMMLALLKVARISANPLHEDSYTDLAGYAACGASAAKALLDASVEITST